MAQASLCPSCSAIDSTSLFGRECDLSKLQLTSPTCDLCQMLFEALDRVGIKPPSVVALRQNGAVVGVEDGLDLLSIYVKPGTWIPFCEYRRVPLTKTF